MTELKTLKDLKSWNIRENDRTIRGSELKAEAVKWMKAFGIDTTIEEKRDSKEFIRNFFNLTEEDISNA